MAEVRPLAELLGQALYQFEQIRPLLPTYGHVIISALFPLYIGAHASLSRPSSAAKASKASKGSDKEAHDDSDDEEDEEEQHGADQKMEGLAPSDALVFPLTAGATLGGLYLVIKYAGADLLNKILGFYFSQMGMFFAMAFIKDAVSVVRSFVFPRKYTRGGRTWKPKPSERIFSVVSVPTTEEPADVRSSPLPGFLGSIPLPGFVVKVLWAFRTVLYWRAKLRIHIHRVVHLECPLGALDILSVLLSLPAVGYFTLYSKPWWLTNFLGFSFCYGTLQLMSPSTFVTGSLILSSLFFYDIYFVYFTPLMVTVAKKLDVPIKLLFPRPPAPSEAPDAVSLAMLGLGDIIVPGMMVGLALRFDLYLYYKLKGTLKARAEGEDSGFIKPVYQTATGGWGERFWVPLARPSETELKPPYSDARSFPKTYFKASIVGYTVGMVTTLVVMQIFDHPQPALLYLVPGVLISLWGTALVKGQIREMWEFSDAEEEEEETNEKGGGEKDEKDQAPAPQKARGLFARIFSGEDTTSQKKDSGSDSKKKEEKEASKNSEDKDGEAKDSKDTDLFSISIYMPRKATAEKSPADRDASESTPDSEENWSYAGAAKQDNEPPAKRRRRSPRHAPAASQ
ncbi:aspartic endopeptidase [Aspergillus stella-maris]|uniref:aspartic endopeptidase n=1 Tax=Aspergillus stella-maris TaxID=1810926 RepID=UPI003CCDFD7B